MRYMWINLIQTFLKIKDYEENIKSSKDPFVRGFYKDKLFDAKNKFTLMAQNMDLVPRETWNILSKDEFLWRKSLKIETSGSFI